MNPDDEPQPPDLAVTAVWLAAAAIVIMGLRGTFLLVIVPGAAAAIAMAVLTLALTAHAGVLLYDRLLAHWPGRQLLWIIPLLDLAFAFVALCAPLAWPTWTGDPEMWRDLAGLPPATFTRLVTLLFLLVAFQVGYLFLRLLGRYLADPRSWRSEARDGLTSVVFASGLVVLACTILYGQAHRPHNVAYMRGWMALGAGGRPADALRAFQDVVERYPDSGLGDACLYRMARIEADDLGHPAEAVVHLKKLIARWPSSPLADDALFDLGELSLSGLDDPAGAATAFAEVRTRYPRSYLTERAALGLARALAKGGRVPEAEAVLAGLETGSARPRIVREDADGHLVVEPLNVAVDAVRRSFDRSPPK